jgi:hypothetical protein
MVIIILDGACGSTGTASGTSTIMATLSSTVVVVTHSARVGRYHSMLPVLGLAL